MPVRHAARLRRSSSQAVEVASAHEQKKEEQQRHESLTPATLPDPSHAAIARRGRGWGRGRDQQLIQVDCRG